MKNKTFRFITFQDMKGYYKGYLEVEAKNMKKARKLLEAMSQDDLEKECFGWQHADSYNTDGDIDVDSSSIHEI